jgi:PEP-CTERM motif-containing protein
MCRSVASHLVFCAVSLLAPLAALATPITVPLDLHVGDTYRLAFVTSTTRDATSANIADYDAFVTAVAAGVPQLAALGTTWNAIGSTPTGDARDFTNTNPSVAVGDPIYTLDDIRIANNNAGLWGGTLLAPLDIDEHGAILNRRVWTGSNSNGTARHNAELASPSNGSEYGNSQQTGVQWMVAGASNPSILNSLYAISGELTVVPEPGTMSLACIGATAVVGWQVRRRRDRKRH